MNPFRWGKFTVRTGDVIHANAEGASDIFDSCLGELAGHARRMYAFEREAHEHLREPGVAAAAKRARLLELLVQYGFAKS